MTKHKPSQCTSLWRLGSCTTGQSDGIICLGFSDCWSDYQFWATNKVKSPISSHQYLRSFRSPIWLYHHP